MKKKEDLQSQFPLKKGYFLSLEAAMFHGRDNTLLSDQPLP